MVTVYISFLLAMDLPHDQPHPTPNNGRNVHETEDADQPMSGIISEPLQVPKVQPSIEKAHEPPPVNKKPDYKLRYIMSGHSMSISSLKFSPDGSLLASSGVLICIVVRL